MNNAIKDIVQSLSDAGVTYKDFKEIFDPTPHDIRVGEALNEKRCPSCCGTGTQYFPNGEDDVNAEVCERCDGNGFLENRYDIFEKRDLRIKYGLEDPKI